MKKSPVENKYEELSNSNLSDSAENSHSKFQTPKIQDFWLKNDFLNLHLFVRQDILKVYYLIFYITVVIFILIVMAVLFPIDWTDNSKINVLMYKIDQWIKYKKVSLKEFKHRKLPIRDLLQKPNRFE